MTYPDILKQVDELKATVAARGPLPAEVLKKINYKFRLEWNYTSNSMEGNTLTRSETRSVMIGNITVHGKPIKDVLEMKGHDEVITSILKMGAGDLQLSEKRIREIHRGIMHEDDPAQSAFIGQWKTQNNYLINYKGERIDFTPHAEVPEAIHSLTDWLAAEREKITRGDASALHPALLAFRFHLDYVSIHPFYDGNGRTARILTNLILIAYGYPPVWVNDGAEKDRYYQYLADVQGYGGSSDVFDDLMSELLFRSQRLVLDAAEGREIEELGDLDKKLALLKKRLGQKYDSRVEINYSPQAVEDVVYGSIKPLVKAWEHRLRDFDPLFQTREILITIPDAALAGQNLETLLEEFIPSRLAHKLSSTKRVTELKIFCGYKNLKSVGKTMGINGGEIRINFHDNLYELVYLGGEEKPIQKLYGEFLDEVEIEFIVESLGNWLFDNIESILNREEEEKS